MTELKEEKKSEATGEDKNVKTVGENPKLFHITITDPNSGKVLMDLTTDIAIIGAVKMNQKHGDNAPSSIYWLGNYMQIATMLGQINLAIGRELGVIEGLGTKGKKVD